MESDHLDFDLIANYLAGIQTIPHTSNYVNVCLYGPTGSAKSTLINYLIGNQMKYSMAKGKFSI